MERLNQNKKHLLNKTCQDFFGGSIKSVNSNKLSKVQLKLNGDQIYNNKNLYQSFDKTIRTRSSLLNPDKKISVGEQLNCSKTSIGNFFDPTNPEEFEINPYRWSKGGWRLQVKSKLQQP